MGDERFWLCSRQLLPYRITERLPVTRPEIQASYSPLWVLSLLTLIPDYF
jgi:hypothetical protein